MASTKGGALQSALQTALRASGMTTRLARPQMVTTTTAGTIQTVVRPHQLLPGQQRIAVHRPGGQQTIIQGNKKHSEKGYFEHSIFTF
jgi:hypothetical protein